MNCGGIPKLTQKTRVDLQNVVMKKGRVLFIHSCDSQSIKINWFHSIYTVYILLFYAFSIFLKCSSLIITPKERGGFYHKKWVVVEKVDKEKGVAWRILYEHPHFSREAS